MYNGSKLGFNKCESTELRGLEYKEGKDKIDMKGEETFKNSIVRWFQPKQ